MHEVGLIALLLDRLNEGDNSAVDWIWQDYFPRLVALARAMLRDMPRRTRDEEHAALNAIQPTCGRVEQRIRFLRRTWVAEVAKTADPNKFEEL